MFKRLRRCHFDVALVVGLAIFFWTYWNRPSSPILRIPFQKADCANLVGISADGRCVLVMKHGTLTAMALPQPTIERWDIVNRKLETEFTLQVPAYDRELLQAVPKEQRDIYFAGYLSPQTDCIHCNLLINPNKPERINRLYDSMSGACLTPRHQFKSAYIRELGGGNRLRQWGLSGDFNLTAEELIDLSDGTVAHRFPYDQERGTRSISISDNQQSLFRLTARVRTPTESRDYRLEVYRIGGWEQVQSLPLVNRGDIILSRADADQIILTDIVGQGDVLSTRFISYRFDVAKNKYQLEEQCMLNEIVRGRGRCWLQGNLLFQQETTQPSLLPTGLVALINRQLDRFNLVLWKSSIQQSVHVYDAQTGQLLRRVTGITEHGKEGLHVSPEAKFLAGSHGFVSNGIMHSHELCIYQVPHYLWEATLGWIQWLSWLLMIPWPLRFFVQGHRAATSLGSS